MGRFLYKSRPPFQICPSCSKKEFGILMISDLSYTRRCKLCDFSDSFSLPTPNKKILYLDQFAISSMVKVKHGRADRRWDILRRALEKGVENQSIVCPYSNVHEDESLMDPKFFEEFQGLYKRLAVGESFLDTNQVQLNQIYGALKKFEGVGIDEGQFPWKKILHHDPNTWNDDVFISINLVKPEERRVLLTGIHDQMDKSVTELTDYFKTNKIDFENQRKTEVEQAANNIKIQYRRSIERRTMAKNAEDFADVCLHETVYADVMRHIIRFFQTKEYNADQIRDKIIEFLKSQEFNEMMYVAVSSILWAGIARRANLGQWEIKTSDYNDIEVMSTYGPYCGALLIDNTMRDLIVTNPVKDSLKGGIKVFSSNTLGEFFDYIFDLIDSQPVEIKKAVSEVYCSENSNNE